MATKKASIDSHLVVPKDQTHLKGAMVISNADQNALNKNKDQLSKTLTEKLQSDSKNTNSKVEVKNVRSLSDGTLALDYECDGVSDSQSAKKTLEKGVKDDNVKKTIDKASKDNPTTARPRSATTKQQRK